MRSNHGERRDRKRDARRQMKKQTQGHPSLPQQEGSGAASSKSPEPAKAGMAPAMVVDPFHGRLVPALPPAHPQGVKRPHSGSKRRLRRQKLRKAMAASAAATSETAGLDHPVEGAGNAEKAEEESSTEAAGSSRRPGSELEKAGHGNPTPTRRSCDGTGHRRPRDVGEGGAVGSGRKAIFPYGNYDQYYGYRYAGGPQGHGSGGTQDPRLLTLREAWFAGKDCLDIGCNAGQFTISIARRFGVRTMLGVDIDEELVHKARANLRCAQPVETTRRPPRLEPQQAPVSVRLPPPSDGDGGGGLSNEDFRRLHDGDGGGELSNEDFRRGGLSNEDFRRLMLGAAKSSKPSAAPNRAPAAGASASEDAALAGEEDAAAAPRPVFPDNVRFSHCNFVQEPAGSAQPSVGQFDVVSCFSTSKWVHLNFGDAGLTKLFQRAHDCLRPGGVFLLEPQPWSSYRKRMHLTPTITNNFREIKIRPPDFAELLTSSHVGFTSAERVEVPYGERVVGANFRRRPLLVLTK